MGTQRKATRPGSEEAAPRAAASSTAGALAKPLSNLPAIAQRLFAGRLTAALLGAACVCAAAPAHAQCVQFAGQSVPASAIGLPTRGALVTSAVIVPATQPGNGNGDYCRITGMIRAVRDDAPAIHFQLNLPKRWNGRALQLGGGGYSGEVVSGTGMVPFAPNATPLVQGYATFGSDSGHVGTAVRAEFALNDEALLNFGYGHLKKTHDVALALITQNYGRAAQYVYFAGGSTGGREGYTVLERFPDDYDGVIADAPSLNFSGVRLLGVRVGQLAYGTPGGFVTPAKQKLVYRRVLAACDALDGVVDGIVSNVAACRALEPQIVMGLRCADGSDQGDGCLSNAQINTLTALREGLRLPYALAYGARIYPGYNVFAGSDYSGTLGLGQSPTLGTPPSIAANGYLFAQADAYMKYFVTRDTTFPTLEFDVTHANPYQERLAELSETVEAMNPDLSAFIAHGGKVITLQGLADEVISPNQTIAFYRAIVAKYGQEITDSFMRLYMVPGFQHGNGVFIPAWDALGALDGWVTRGIAPETLAATDIAPATNGRSRPLCRFPAFPRYLGKGNVNLATSFRCSTS
jgi:Tannase and feruloyl esterase